MSDETPDETPVPETRSVYDGFVYAPRRESARKGAHERTTGHQWCCLRCKSIVHTEELIGFDHEETHAEASARHLRINTALMAHRAAHETEDAEEAKDVEDEAASEDGSGGGGDACEL